MKRRGLTLIELLIVLAMTGIILVGLTGSYEIALRFQREVPAREAERQAELSFIKQLRLSLEGAYLSEDEDDLTSYFIATSADGVSGNPDTITFTTTAFAPSGDFIAAEGDFETLHADFGPQGGLTELGLTARSVASSAFGENNLCNDSFHAMNLDVTVELAVTDASQEGAFAELNALVVDRIEEALPVSGLSAIGRMEVRFVAPEAAWRCVTLGGGTECQRAP